MPQTMRLKKMLVVPGDSISRILCDGYTFDMNIVDIIYLGSLLPMTSSDLPEKSVAGPAMVTPVGAPAFPIWSCFAWGLPSQGCRQPCW